MLQFKFLKRFTVLSLSMFCLSITASYADTVSYFGFADDSPIVSYFDPSLGTLNSVNINYTIIGDIIIRGQASGPSDQDALPYDVEGSVDGDIVGPAGGVSPSSESFSLSGSVIPSFGGNTFFELVSFALNTPAGGTTISGAGVTPFIDTGSFGFLTFAAIAFCEGGETTVIELCQIQRLSGTFDLTYDYTPSSLPQVPVPAAIWLFSSALIGLIAFGKRRSTTA